MSISGKVWSGAISVSIQYGTQNIYDETMPTTATNRGLIGMDRLKELSR